MKISTLLVATLGLGAMSAMAQGAPDGSDGPPGGPPPGPGRRPVPPIVAALDTDSNGVIDASEIANASASLKTLDKNGDGKLTPDELRPPRPAWMSDTNAPPPGAPPGGPGTNGRRPPFDPIVAALDTNKDGVIDADEIANAPAALKTLDKNGDGKLTPDEYRPPRRNGPPPGFNGPGGPRGPGAGGGPGMPGGPGEGPGPGADQ